MPGDKEAGAKLFGGAGGSAAGDDDDEDIDLFGSDDVRSIMIFRCCPCDVG